MWHHYSHANNGDGTHTLTCTSCSFSTQETRSCQIDANGTHSIFYSWCGNSTLLYTSNSDGTHTRSCMCGFSDTHNTVFTQIDEDRHSQTCATCNYSAIVAHTNCTYRSLPIIAGDNRLVYHTKTCQDCGYSGCDSHDWQYNGTNYTCTLCKMISTSAPGLMSIPKDKSEVAEALPEADACCAEDSAVYYVAILPEAVTTTEGQTSCSHPALE